MKALVLSIICLGVACAQDLNRGIELYRKNNFDEAASNLRKVVEQDGNNARANQYLGLTLLEQGNASEAEPFILKSESKTALARLCIAKKDYDGAAAALKDSNDEETPYVRGLLALARKQYDPAARDLESFMKSYPEFAYAHYYAGLAYSGMKRQDKMLTQFEMFVKMKPDAPESRKVRSVLQSGR